MHRVFCCVLLFVTSTPALSAEPTFRDILKNVTYHEPRTGAIGSVRQLTARKGQVNPAASRQFELTIKGNTAHVEIYRNLITGRDGDKFTFPVDAEIKAEYARQQNLEQLRVFDLVVNNAERRRRIFLLSSFKLRQGSSVEDVEDVFGKPTSVTAWMKQGWATMVFRDVTVTVSIRRVHDIRLKRGK